MKSCARDKKMTSRLPHLMVLLAILSNFPTTETLVFQCYGKSAITENFKLGPTFGKNYCLAYGEILSAAIDDLENDSDSGYDSEGIKCSDQSNAPSCFKDHGQNATNNEDSKLEEGFGKCLSKIMNTEYKNPPWHATLKSYSYRSKKLEIKCDAVIIHPSVILTDSSCYSGKEKLFIADSDQKRGLELYREKKIYKYLVLVRLKSALKFTRTTRSACLPFASINVNEPCTLIIPSGSQIEAEVLNTTVCLSGLSSADQRDGKHLHTFCTSCESKRKCQLDSKTRSRGAPLFCKLSGREDEFVVTGIVPKMFRCDGSQPLEYFSDLQLALEWISQTFSEWGLDVSSFTP